MYLYIWHIIIWGFKSLGVIGYYIGAVTVFKRIFLFYIKYNVIIEFISIYIIQYYEIY